MTSQTSPLPRGFRWSASTAGIKASGRTDLALAVADQPCTAAVLYTANQVVAAPVTIGREHLAATHGTVRAVLVNAGNANCATGPDGLAAARETCATLAQLLGCDPHQIIPSSTGIIGVPLPTEKIIAILPHAVDALASTPAAGEAFSTAILTTDTRIKQAADELTLANGTIRLFGCCKGAGMIGPELKAPLANSPAAQPNPNHATMLVYLFTDLAIPASDLQILLTPAVDDSFNNISIDGDTSTNDTVLLLASGASGVHWSSLPAPDQQAFQQLLHRVCHQLAGSIVDDGEGVTHVITLHVIGTADDSSARQIAKSIANSPLCKTAWSSADPNWGRILAAAGRGGIPFQLEHVSIHIAGLPVFEHGTRSAALAQTAQTAQTAIHTRMLERAFDITIRVGPGPGQCRFLTSDLTTEYVRINADYST